MNKYDQDKLLMLKKYKGNIYNPNSLTELYDDYHDLCYRIKKEQLLKNKLDSEYNFINIKEIDLTHLKYEELEKLNYHWTPNLYQKEIDRYGIPAIIGENSKRIDESPSIFFSKGVEGVLELWNTWLKWRLYRLESPLYDVIKDDEVDNNIKRYIRKDITLEEKIRLGKFNKSFKNKEFLKNNKLLNKLFEYQFVEMLFSSYYVLDINGLRFNPLLSIDYNKLKYIRGNKSNKFLEIQYDYYSNLDSIYSDKWNYKINCESLCKKEPIIIDNNKIKVISVDGKRNLNTVLLFLYNIYNENVPKDEKIKFDTLDNYIEFIKGKFIKNNKYI